VPETAQKKLERKLCRFWLKVPLIKLQKSFFFSEGELIAFDIFDNFFSN